MSAHVLVVDDSDDWIGEIAHRYESRLDVVHATNRADALALLEHRDDFVGVISEVRLGSDDPRGGLIVLATAARRAPGVVRVALTRDEEDPHVRRAAREVGAVCVPKERYHMQLDPFVHQMLQWAAARPWRASEDVREELSSVPPPALDEAAEALRIAVFADAMRRDLTEDQAASLYAMVRGLDRSDAAEELGCSLSTHDKRLVVVRARYGMKNGELRRYFTLRLGARRGAP